MRIYHNGYLKYRYECHHIVLRVEFLQRYNVENTNNISNQTLDTKQEL